LNRWRQRLAELHGAGKESPSTLPSGVQNVQNEQNPLPGPVFEHFAQIEQPTDTAPPFADRALARWGEAEDERAGIVQYDGKIPREWADGIGQFLDRWAGEAAALGWGAADIFGADADRPGITWLNAGPLWSGDGARVVELHEDRLVVETKSGTRQTAYRRPHLRPRVLPWGLAP